MISITPVAFCLHHTGELSHVERSGQMLLGKSEAGQDRRVNLFGCPTADVAAAVEQNLGQPDHPGFMDFDARIAKPSQW